MSISPVFPPMRGEIWIVNFDPTVGTEIKKSRPAVVLSSDAIAKLPLKLVAPITEWNDRFSSSFWHVPVSPDSANGLTKESAVDTLQLRGMDLQRFVRKLGRVSATVMVEIAAAVAGVVEYQ